MNFRLCPTAIHIAIVFVVININTTLAAIPQDTASPKTIAEDKFFTTRQNPIQFAMPSEKDSFHFVIYGDRTGGVPAGLKVLKQAVADTNLLSPDLVMTVGDLIQGYNRTPQWLEQKDEFKKIMNQLDADWFPVAGNHDVYWQQRDKTKPAGQHESNYEKHFGPLWYSFKHKDTGFLVLYSDEGDREKNEKGFREGRLQSMSDEQLDFMKDALAQLKDQKQVFVFLHHPRWIGGGYSGGNWDAVHKNLVDAGNVSAVFAGHIHRMRFDGKKDGIEYFTLATTGGHLSEEDFPDAGFLHHFNVVTVRDDEFQVAAIPVGAVVDPRSFTREFLAEIETVRNQPLSIAKRLPLQVDGAVSGFYEIEIENPVSHSIEVALTANVQDGWEVIPDHQHRVIEPSQKEKISFRFLRDADTEQNGKPTALTDFDAPVLELETDLLHENSRVRMPVVSTPVEMTLAKIPDDFFQNKSNKAFQFDPSSGKSDGIRIESSACQLPQGPFTVEAWVNSSSNDGSQGVVAKTQSSEYAIFVHNGKPSFDVHLDGRYVTAKATESLPLNSWKHLAGVFDGNEVRLYIDGELIKTTKGSGKRTINQLPIYIGADPGRKGESTRPFIGQVDEIRLSKIARYDKSFRPDKRFQPDNETIFLFHLDRQIGPFVFDHGPSSMMARRIGDQGYAERE
jgi:hypothetical protein